MVIIDIKKYIKNEKIFFFLINWIFLSKNVAKKRCKKTKNFS